MPAPEVTAPKDHVVHLYDAEADLVASVTEYLVSGLQGGEVGVVIATHDHIRAFRSELSAIGIDVDALVADGRLIWLDAVVTLETIMNADRPDRGAFDAAIGGTLRSASQRGPVRAYGEMVAVLWDQGLVGSAMELEALWNGLRNQLPFTLLCSYPADSITEDDEETFTHLCQLHSDVLGSGLPRCLHQEAPVLDTRSRSFPPEPTSARAARAFFAEVVHEWDESAVLANGSLIVAELAANAVGHARSAFVVTLRLRSGTLEISVRDDAATVPLRRTPPPHSASGRGMQIISAVAERWGTQMGDSGKTVWAELSVRPDG